MARQRTIPDELIVEAALTLMQARGPEGLTLAELGSLVELSAATLVQRYSESRRRHPLTDRLQRGGTAPTLTECIALERELLAPLREQEHVIDTSDLTPGQLRVWIRDLIKADRAPLVLTFESFAYKRGVPRDADLVFDVRCLPNPYWKPELREQSGLDKGVQEYLAEQPDVEEIYQDTLGYLNKWLPRFAASNRAYVTIAIGCTGGHHRSVYLAERIGNALKATLKNVQIRHRDLS